MLSGIWGDKPYKSPMAQSYYTPFVFAREFWWGFISDQDPTFIGWIFKGTYLVVLGLLDIVVGSALLALALGLAPIWTPPYLIHKGLRWRSQKEERAASKIAAAKAERKEAYAQTEPAVFLLEESGKQIERLLKGK